MEGAEIKAATLARLSLPKTVAEINHEIPKFASEAILLGALGALGVLGVVDLNAR